MKKIYFLAIVIIGFASRIQAQGLPLSGGTMTGPAIGPAFIQTGAYRDFAPSSVLTTSGTNINGGAINRGFNSITQLTAGQYMTVDLGTPIGVAYLSFGCHWASDPRFIPLAYAIDYSNDNSNWTNLVTVTSNYNANPVHSVSVAAQYWRLTVNATQVGISTSQITGFQIVTSGYGSVASNFWNCPSFGDGIFTKSPVGIGTTDDLPAGYMLGVNGGILATKVLIQTLANWPDYVFKSTYNLKPLSEVKTYVDLNHHLPDMPSEKEVAEKGIDVGEMNKILTKKVEELTLYMIDLQKEVQHLKKLNDKQ